MPKVLTIGHRGAKGYYPENTLASFAHALALGCDWIELDVYLAHGELLVIHDKAVDRTTNGHGLISDYSLAALRALDAGNGQQIPLLGEVLDMIDGRCGVNVELKGPGTAAPVSECLNNYVQRGWPQSAFLISSFDHLELARADPGFRRGVLFGALPADWLASCQALSGWSANFYQKDVTPDLVNTAHDNGLKVLTYTANDHEDIQRVLNAGVDGVFSDYPDRVLAALA